MLENGKTDKSIVTAAPLRHPSELIKDRTAWSVLILAGIAVFLWKWGIVSAIRFIGFGDPAGYAALAQSILDGRGLEVDYISMHFHQGVPSISHPEDTWPPLYALCIVPFFAFLGKTALAAKLPSMLIACFAFPPVTFGLAKRITRSNKVALAAGLTLLFYEPVFTWSLQATADVTFGFLSTLALFFALKGVS
ncbi:MAG: glycosyltransferase family 39 protein, partial [Planctomycetes bacterium]|nr:glycosyltransferase family 39 protein [Planctomycetota bacterium]